MTRQDVILTVLAATGGTPLSFIHLQKAIFAFHQAQPQWFDNPSDYRFLCTYLGGPFSRQVYADIRALKSAGLIEVMTDNKLKSARATDMGQRRGDDLLATADIQTTKRLRDNAKYLASQSPGQIICRTLDSYLHTVE